MGEKIYGFHAIEESLKIAPAGSTLYVCREIGKKAARLQLAAQATGKVAVKKVSRQEMDRLAPGVDHRGVVLDMGRSRRKTSSVRVENVKTFCEQLGDDDDALVLVLDEITDPHNLGAILRSCDQFGVSLVIMPERNSVRANETVMKVSSGAAQYVPIAVVTNLGREIDYLKAHGFWVYGADMDGDASYDTGFSGRTVLVMGSEGHGIRDLVRKKCDHIVSIPMVGHIDSLNVSVAAGILLYEVRRPRIS